MRTVTTVDLRREPGGTLDFVTHFHVDQLDPGGDVLRKLYDEIPKPTRAMRGRDAPGPDHPDIESVLADHKFHERTGEWFRAADALSLICQATTMELDLNSIIGCTTVLVGHTPVNGIVSRSTEGGQQRVSIRLRGAPDVLYPATESVVRTAFRVAPNLGVNDVQSVAKERGSDVIFERLTMVLIRKTNVLGVMRGAARAGLIDSIALLLGMFALVGFLCSWLLHFHPSWLGLSNWKVVDVAWLDGWVGRLSTSAIFGLVTSIGVVMLTVRRVLGEDDLYLHCVWQRDR